MRSKSYFLKVGGPEGTLFLNFVSYKGLNVQNFINQNFWYFKQYFTLCHYVPWQNITKLIGLKAGINKSNADGKCVRLVIYSTNY